MKLRSLNYRKSQQRFEALSRSGRFVPNTTLDDDLVKLRAETRRLLAEETSGAAYARDLAMGLALYQTLPDDFKQGRSAADDGVWRFLSLEVLPDLVFARAGPNEAWFYSSKRRLWLKRCWWYVHLAWQGSVASTRRAVAGMTTDTVAQLVERPGAGGFRVDLWRELASRFEQLRPSESDVRRLMKTNTALLVVVEPAFGPGGVPGYVDRLYQTLGRAEPSPRLGAGEPR